MTSSEAKEKWVLCQKGHCWDSCCDPNPLDWLHHIYPTCPQDLLKCFTEPMAHTDTQDERRKIPTGDAASTDPIDGHTPSVGPQMKWGGVLVLPAAQSQKGCSQSKSPPNPSLHLPLEQLLGVPKFKVDIIQKQVASGVNSCYLT